MTLRCYMCLINKLLTWRECPIGYFRWSGILGPKLKLDISNFQGSRPVTRPGWVLDPPMGVWVESGESGLSGF